MQQNNEPRCDGFDRATTSGRVRKQRPTVRIAILLALIGSAGWFVATNPPVQASDAVIASPNVPQPQLAMASG
ncbi:hypothetical protein, partial [Ilumatobacter sp.]|uniref:hypothetical protein n=1 Tax=Ilumatobacter sp. TaxID=1967498 RepID=UPI003C628442